MNRIFLLFVILVVAFATSASPAAAQGPGGVYVDPYRTGGNEDGTKENPYNKEAEGKAYLQALPYGGDLYIKNQDGTWGAPIVVDPAKPGISGTLLPKSTLYTLLAVFALALILAGWQFQRRSRQLQS